MVLDKIARGRPCKVIYSGETPYLIRIYMSHDERGGRTYLHKFLTSDGERWLHNHPFHAETEILSGGYVEERIKILCHIEPGVYKLWHTEGEAFAITGDTFHRIVSVEPNTWTLFKHGPHYKYWGFLEWSDGKMVLHNPFPQSGGSEWWLEPGCKVYMP